MESCLLPKTDRTFIFLVEDKMIQSLQQTEIKVAEEKEIQGYRKLEQIRRSYDMYRQNHFTSLGLSIASLPLIKFHKACAILPLIFGNLAGYHWNYANYHRERAKNVTLNYSLPASVMNGLYLGDLYYCKSREVKY
jgi:hypothetical protein